MPNLNVSKSIDFQKRAKRLIPGMSQLLSKRPDRFSYGVWPGYYSKAKGVEIWDLDGNQYLDMSIGGIGANIFGYADPEIDEPVINSILRGSSCSLNCPEEVYLAELLCEVHPWAEMVRYARTGGEAMAIAIRIARTFSNKEKLLFCGYHGWHDWYLAANLGKKDVLNGHLQAGLEPNGVPSGLYGTSIPFNFNNFDELESLVGKHKNEIAAIVMEPVRNIEPADGFLKSICEIAKENNIVLIIDEISSGFRINTGGAHLKYNITPDIAVFSKALGNGYPIAAIIGKSAIMEAAQKTFISSTNWTERIGPVAATAVIKKHKNLDAGKHLVHIGKSVQDGIKNQSEKYGLNVRVEGIPPLTHFSFVVEKQNHVKALYIQLMMEKKILASTHFYSMYPHSMEHVKQYVKAMGESFEEIAYSLQKGDLEKRLIGQPSVSGFKRFN